jgi:dipeptidyl aminopeptidase/acylaminoacyl peptidase
MLTYRQLKFMRLPILAGLLSLSSLVSAAPRGVTAEDYYNFKNVTDARISPNGKLVVYTVTSVDQQRNRRFSEIWLTATDGSRPGSPFTTGLSSQAPRWSPDGRSVAFISTRPVAGSNAGHSDRPQVHLLSMSGGEARRLTDLEAGVESFQWSPQGDRLVCVSKTGPKRTPFDKDGSDVRHYTSSNYKFNDTGYYDERRSHLFAVNVKTGESTQITSGDERNDLEPQWSPDGLRIAFIAEDTSRPALENDDLCVVPAAGGALSRISDAPGFFRSPRWSPDGTRVAYAGSVSADELPKIQIVPAAGGKSVLASTELDLSPGDLNWASERTLYFEAPARGENQLFRVDPQTGKFAAITSGPRSVRRMDFNKETGAMVYIANDFKHLDDLYAAGGAIDGEKQLTDVNQNLLSQLEMQDVERITFKGSDGALIDGFFVKPLGWRAGKKYPMVLSIHGGPASMSGVDWFHEFQVYASHGWAVFFTNPHGSTGYWEKFQRSVAKSWGGKPFVDLMNGVDAMLAKYPWIDSDRLGVTGGSYGGFMTNWIVSHTTRFKAAVTLRSIANFTSVEGTRDGAYGHTRDFGGDLFQNFDFYWDSSPLKYAGKVKTPTLVLHSDGDQRVPLEQGEQWFRALKHFGVTTEMVIFPRENHNLTRTGEPRHLVESLNWQIYWFERFLDENARAVRPNER